MNQTLTLRHGDCVEVLKGYADGSLGAVISDPPYGLEFMGKPWDRLDWTDGGGMMSVGMGGREIPWPSYSGTGAAGTANATCANCGGRMRGVKRCSCGKPDWRVKGQPINQNANAERMRKQQESHMMWLAEAYRALRPGRVIKAFSGSRTFHHLAAAVVEVGFTGAHLEAWLYGSGFPKSLNVSKSIEGKLTTGSAQKNGFHRLSGEQRAESSNIGMYDAVVEHGFRKRQPTQHGARTLDATTPEAQRWNGWGTALKPAWEPVLVGVKPCG